MKALLGKLADVFRGLVDLDRDGKIEASEVMTRILQVAPILSDGILRDIVGHIGTLASLGRVVSADGTPWTREQVEKALDHLIARARQVRGTFEADSAAVRAELAKASNAGGASL